MLFLVSSYTNAQDSTLGKWMVSARMNYGFMIAHRPTVMQLQKTHVYGFEAELFKTSSGTHDWEQAFNKPLTGIGFQYFNLGDNAQLGGSYSIFPQILFPINRSPHLLLSARIGCGLGYIDKKFNTLTKIIMIKKNIQL